MNTAGRSCSQTSASSASSVRNLFVSSVICIGPDSENDPVRITKLVIPPGCQTIMVFECEDHILYEYRDSNDGMIGKNAIGQ